MTEQMDIGNNGAQQIWLVSLAELRWAFVEEVDAVEFAGLVGDAGLGQADVRPVLLRPAGSVMLVYKGECDEQGVRGG